MRKKPSYNKNNDVEFWGCPECGEIISYVTRTETNRTEYETPLNCKKCGASIDWYVFTPDEIKNIMCVPYKEIIDLESSFFNWWKEKLPKYETEDTILKQIVERMTVLIDLIETQKLYDGDYTKQYEEFMQLLSEWLPHLK